MSEHLEGIFALYTTCRGFLEQRRGSVATANLSCFEEFVFALEHRYRRWIVVIISLSRAGARVFFF